MPFGSTGTHGHVSVLGCLQTTGLQPGGFLPPAAGLVFKGLISKSHICTSGSELWDSFNTVRKRDSDFSVKTLDLLFSLSSELCHDFPQASWWLYFHSSAEIQQIPVMRRGAPSGKDCLSL